MSKWLKFTIVAPVLALLGYVLVVQVLRAIAFGDDERDALAVMEPLPPPPAGESGFRFLAFVDLEVPPAELEGALSAELSAFREWHEGSGLRSLGDLRQVARFASPAAARFPPRPPHERPAAACHLADLDCIGKLRGNEAPVREWLAREGARLALAEQALRAQSLASPFPPAYDAPLAGFKVLNLPLNAIALQSLDGDAGGALARACGLLASGRRFLRQDGGLVDKMVHASLVDGASALLLSLRRADPSVPMPADCGAALAPVDPGDYLVCGALKSEHAMATEFILRNDKAMADSGSPSHWLTRLVLSDATLMRGWSAEGFAPLCSEAGLAQIALGRSPAVEPRDLDRVSVDFWAAPVSHILTAIKRPAYAQFQDRLLDYAAKLRLHLAAIAVAQGELAAADLPRAASAPGYAVQPRGGDWVVPLKEGRKPQPPERRIPIAQ